MSDAIKFIPNFNNTNITINLLEQMSVLIEDKTLEMLFRVLDSIETC
jgi:hypothetical protein